MRLPRMEQPITSLTFQTNLTSSVSLDSDLSNKNPLPMDRNVRSSSVEPSSGTPHADDKPGKRQPRFSIRESKGDERTPADPLDLVMAKRKRKELADPVMAEAIRTASKLPPPRLLYSEDNDQVPEELQQLILFGLDRGTQDENSLEFFRNYPLHLSPKPTIKPFMDYPISHKYRFRERYLDPVFRRYKLEKVCEEDELEDGKELSSSYIHSDEDWFMESFLHVLCVLLIVLTLPLSLIFCLKVVAHYERAVLFRLGRLVSATAQGPGLIIVLPCLDRYRILDLRTFTFDVPTQEVLTKDSVTVVVNAVVYYRVRDPVRAVVNVEDANRATRVLGQTTLRNVLGTVNLDQLLTAREDIAALMQECLDSVTEAWGVKVERVEIKDVRLPIQLQRAMAAEAESVREATAKVIAAEGEMRAASALKAAASEIGQHPIAMQLRYLQAVNSISSGKESTIVFPVPLDLLSLIRLGQESGIKENYVLKHAREADTARSVKETTPIDFTDVHFLSGRVEHSQIV